MVVSTRDSRILPGYNLGLLYLDLGCAADAVTGTPLLTGSTTKTEPRG